MDAFLSIIFNFPTIFFTGLLALAAMLWLAIIVNKIKPWQLDKILRTALGVDEQGQSLSPFLRRWQRDGVPLSVGWSLWVVISWLLSGVITTLLYPYLTDKMVALGVAIILLVIIPILAAAPTLKLLPSLKPWVDSWVSTQKQRLQALMEAEERAKQRDADA
ncbi:hypothetical protein [Thiofilum flexile]|uniref:hypothetical protein n=1 Tax=Thiofilum flexile TaxID=125627 RepID=UPI00036863BC|nr:hypothetical protein [Thiofilum flexile]